MPRSCELCSDGDVAGMVGKKLACASCVAAVAEASFGEGRPERSLASALAQSIFAARRTRVTGASR